MCTLECVLPPWPPSPPLASLSAELPPSETAVVTTGPLAAPWTAAESTPVAVRVPLVVAVLPPACWEPMPLPGAPPVSTSPLLLLELLPGALTAVSVLAGVTVTPLPLWLLLVAPPLPCWALLPPPVPLLLPVLLSPPPVLPPVVALPLVAEPPAS